MNFNEIIKQNGQSIRNIIKKITNKENEDLEQEVYLRVLKNANKYKEGNFKSWINTIARNISLDYLKSAKVKKETLLSDGESYVFEQIQDKKQTPETKLIQNEEGKIVYEGIKKLKPKLKEVIVLTEFYDLSYEECAKRLNCPVGTVKSRVYNAKKELMIILKDLL